MKIKHCLDCGVEFEVTYDIQAYCPLCMKFRLSDEKDQKRETRKAKEKKMIDDYRDKIFEQERICAVCGNPFHSRTKNTSTCGNTCARELGRRTRAERTVKVEKRKPKKLKNDINTVLAEARKQGLSYGQYVQKLEIERLSREREERNSKKKSIQ